MNPEKEAKEVVPRHRVKKEIAAGAAAGGASVFLVFQIVRLWCADCLPWPEAKDDAVALAVAGVCGPAWAWLKAHLRRRAR